MSDILSQDEIEALLATLSNSDNGGDSDSSSSSAFSSGSSQPSPSSSPSRSDNNRKTIAYGVYDFRRPDKFSRDQLRTMQMLHETFARLSSSALAAYLRSTAHIELISLEQVPYDEYLRAINRSIFVVYNVPPLAGQSVLEMELSLVYTILDRALGGPGRTSTRTNLTDIERGLVDKMSQLLFTSLKSAWENVMPINPSIDSIETSSQFVQIAPPNDIVVTILFEVKIGEQRGTMSICIPYLVLKPITQKLVTQRWFSTGTKRSGVSMRNVVAKNLTKSSVHCVAQLGKTRLKVSDFLSLKVGDVLKLDQQTENEMPLLVGNKPKYYGKPALKGKKLVFTITGYERD